MNNSIRLVTTGLQKHVSSPLYIVGRRALISYAGQPVTCYVCNAAEHLAKNCRKRSFNFKLQGDRQATQIIWAQMIYSDRSECTTRSPAVTEHTVRPDSVPCATEGTVECNSHHRKLDPIALYTAATRGPNGWNATVGEGDSSHTTPKSGRNFTLKLVSKINGTSSGEVDASSSR